MTGDKHFMKERGLRRRKKAKNVLQGFEQGATSLFNGVFEGITGVVTLPYRETRDHGPGGLLPGIFKGITGIITKPLSGIFDTVSKTAEVVKGYSREYKTLQEEDLRISKELVRQEPFTMRIWSSKNFLLTMQCTMTH
jgi:hypothetical protein